MAWIPSLLGQKADTFTVAVVGAKSPLSVGSTFDYLLRLVAGHPALGLSTIPSDIALALLAASAIVAVVGLAWMGYRGSRRRGSVSVPGGSRLLVLIVALATPVGLLLYAAVADNLYNTRNLSVSLPAVAIAVGWLLTSPPRRFALVACSLGIIGLVVGTVVALGGDYRRPASKQVAHYIDEHARPGDAVVTSVGESNPAFPMGFYFDRPHSLVEPGINDADAWKRAARGHSVFLVVPRTAALRGVGRLGGPDTRSILRDKRVFPGLLRVSRRSDSNRRPPLTRVGAPT